MKTNAVSLGSRENSGVPSLIERKVPAGRGPTFEMPVKAYDEVAKSVKANARNEETTAIFLLILSLKQSLLVGMVKSVLVDSLFVDKIKKSCNAFFFWLPARFGRRGKGILSHCVVTVAFLSN